MTKEKLAGIDFIVYKNNIYDVSDIEKVEEVQAKYNVELEDYQLKVERYNEFLGKISSDSYQYLYKDIYYFDGVKEYKLNQGNVSSVNYFDGGVFFKIDKEFPIIPLKLSDIINSGYTNLNDPINNLLSEKKGCYYVYKGLDGFSHADLNTIMNNSVEFVNVDKRGYINIAYTNYEKDTVYYSLKTISPDYNRVEDEVEKNKYTRISRARITSDNKYEMYKQYIGKNGLMTQIGRDDARLNVSISNNQDGIYLSNNDYNINEEIILFKTDYNSSSNSIGTLYAYNNKTNKSSKLADNVRAAIVYNDNEGLYITANNNGTYDLRYGKNIINNSIDCIVDLSGNISKERRLKPIDLKDKKKKSNKKEEVEEEIIPYVATKSYLVAGRDYSEQQAFEIEIPFMEKIGFETLEDGNKMYNKGNLKYARNEWVDVGPFRYHFDSSGIMEVSKWIDDLYYVNHVGVMVKNTRTPDGFRVDANGELIDDSELKRQAEILAARTTQEEKNKKNSSSNSSSSGSKSSSGSSQSGASSTTQQKSTKTANANATLNTNATEVESSSRKFYVSGYKILKSYVAGGSGYDCDIYINYPIISSKDEPEEASLINQAIQDELEVMRIEAEGTADAEDVLPRQYVINKAKVSTISTSKVVIVLSGAMAIPGKTNKTVKMTITYDREDESADVS